MHGNECAAKFKCTNRCVISIVHLKLQLQPICINVQICHNLLRLNLFNVCIIIKNKIIII